VNGVTFTWDNKGNLLNDGASTYTYDHANRLRSVVQGAATYGYSYNGLGDRLRQTVNGSPTNYTVDLAAGLTQVLADGPNTYLYGVTRIGEEQAGGWQYHMGDALGSVRQLTNTGAAVTMAMSYEPFGDTITSAGSAATAFQFTGEQRDATGLTYLRARYYASSTARYISRDPWDGDPKNPASFNAWLYVGANPIIRVDPSGFREAPGGCDEIADPNGRDLCRIESFLNTRSAPSSRPPKITWFPVSTTSDADIRDYRNRLYREVNGAQYQVAAGWNGLCGLISLAAILNVPVKQGSWIIEEFLEVTGRKDPNYQTGSELARFINQNDTFATQWSASYRKDRQYGNNGRAILRSTLTRGFSLPLVEIVSASSKNEIGGQVGETIRAYDGCNGTSGAKICHWVVITGLSNQWDQGRPESTFNWIRIFNPFDNDTEYYRWKDFSKAWLAATQRYSEVILERKDHP
jgi:RHS repeat-associated protein